MEYKLDFEITVSPLVRTDLPSILEIECESQPEPWTERAFLEEICRVHSSVLVARTYLAASAGSPRTSEIAGYLCFWLVQGEIQILNIAVRKSLRRRGIARRLIGHAIRTGLEQNARSASLEVRENNLAARRLYESFGFREVGRRPGYYGVQNESAIIMELVFEMPDSQDVQRREGKLGHGF